MTRCMAALAAAVITATAAPALAAPVEQAPRPVVGGWFGWWAADSAINRVIDESAGAVPEVNIFWWFFAGRSKPLCTYSRFDGGCVTSATPWTNPTLDAQRQRLQQAGIKVLASITDLGPTYAGQLAPYLTEETDRRAYAAQITDWAVKAGVDGVDLDWENFAFRDGSSTWPTTKPKWVAFIRELSAQLHAKGLLLSATVPGGVPPFRTDGTPNPGTGYSVYAWSEIIEFVDRLRIMAYDYSWTYPGPIGPNDWAGEVVRSAVAQVTDRYAHRIWIGVPQYGRDWVRRTSTGGFLTQNCPATWTPNASRETVTNGQEARALAVAEGVDVTWDADAGEWWFRYTAATPGTVAGTGGTRVARTCQARREVWFADSKSAVARAALVPEYRIGGIAVWTLGDVDPDFYSTTAEYAFSIAPQPTEVQVQAPRVAKHGAMVAVRVSATSTAEVPAGAKVGLLWSATVDGARTRVGSGVLGGDGTATITAPVGRSGYWWANVGGSWARRSGASDQIVGTSVRYNVTVSASDPTPVRGQEVRIAALMTPAVKGTAVQFQRRVLGEWKTLQALTVSMGGGASARFTPKVARELEFRFVIAASDGIVRTTSPILTLSVSR